jgi:hypothetical protein
MLSLTQMNKSQRLCIFILLLSLTLSVYTVIFSHMNNWLIFKHSFRHLLNGLSLYQLYPDEAKDIFLYSPSFALAMAPLSYLPDALGATLWNLIGASLLLWAIMSLPINDNAKRATIWISLPEFIGSTQNFQSNIHMTAIILWFWIHMEKQKSFLSSLCILSGFFIKIFGIVLAASYLNLHYSLKNPRFLGKSILYFVLVFISIFLAPLLITSWENLLMHYDEWLHLHQGRSGQVYGFSLMGVIHSLSGWQLNNFAFQVGGGLALLASLFYHRNDDVGGRLLGLVSIMYFMVLFNHGSESPTYIIVMVAFAIHQSMMANKNLRWGLIIFTLGCISALYADPFRQWRPSFDYYAIKAWPLIVLYPMALLRTGIRTQRLSFLHNGQKP